MTRPECTVFVKNCKAMMKDPEQHKTDSRSTSEVQLTTDESIFNRPCHRNIPLKLGRPAQFDDPWFVFSPQKICHSVGTGT